jgi:pyruvate-formate lyase-activating enzyme
VVEGKYADIVPVSFEFVPTLNCIYRCHQCAYRRPKEELGIWSRNDYSPAFHMNAECMLFLLRKLREAGVIEVLFTGGGEPLLNDATVDGMQHAHDLGLKVGLYTNGALVDAKKAKAIMEAAPAYVRVSLNAGERRVYYQHHNPLVVEPSVDYFSMNQSALCLLSKEKARLQNGTVLGVSYLVGPDNAADVLGAARLVAAVARAHPKTIGYMRFTPSVDYFGGRQHPREIFESAVNLIETEVTPLLADAGVEARVYSHRFVGLYEPRPYDGCLAAGWFGGVGPGGILYWCCEKLFQPSFAFGSLLNGSFASLWGGTGRERVAAFVDAAVKGRTTSPCPVVCKPHEHNKVFAKVEKRRGQGEIEVVRTWLRQIHRVVSSAQAAVKPRLDGFQS